MLFDGDVKGHETFVWICEHCHGGNQGCPGGRDEHNDGHRIQHLGLGGGLRWLVRGRYDIVRPFGSDQDTGE